MDSVRKAAEMVIEEVGSQGRTFVPSWTWNGRLPRQEPALISLVSPSHQISANTSSGIADGTAPPHHVESMSLAE